MVRHIFKTLFSYTLKWRFSSPYISSYVLYSASMSTQTVNNNISRHNDAYKTFLSFSAPIYDSLESRELPVIPLRTWRNSLKKPQNPSSRETHPQKSNAQLRFLSKLLENLWMPRIQKRFLISFSRATRVYACYQCLMSHTPQ